MSLVRITATFVGCYLIAAALMLGFPWVVYLCMHALWQAFEGAMLYRSSAYLFLQGTGQLVLALILILQAAVACVFASIIVASANDRVRYDWYVYRGGIPVFYIKYRQNKSQWRAIAFGKTA